MDLTEFQNITYRNDLNNYLINRNGEIYSLHKHTTLTGTRSGSGYIIYTLRNDRGKIVRLPAHIAVAKQYIANNDPRHKTVVNHKDEDKGNPCAYNLEWVTPGENARYGTGMKRSGNKKKKPINEYTIDGRYIRTWASARDVGRFYIDLLDCNEKHIKSIERSINNCCRGKQYHAYGRVWRYLTASNKRDIDVGVVINPNHTSSQARLKLDYNGTVPEEYLHHELTKREIKDYFMNHDRLTEYEKSLLKKLWGI